MVDFHSVLGAKKIPIEKQIRDYKKFFEDLLEQWSDLFVSNFDSFLHRLNGHKDTSNCKNEFATQAILLMRKHYQNDQSSTNILLNCIKHINENHGNFESYEKTCQVLLS